MKYDKMLPSMPILMTPMKELRDDSSDTSDDSPVAQHSAEEGGYHSDNIRTESRAQMEKADDVGLTSTCPSDTIAESTEPDFDKVNGKPLTPEKRSLAEPTSAQKKKKKTQHKKILAALTPETGPAMEISAQNFAEAYFQKVRGYLDDEKWTQFVQELVEFEEKNEKQPTELYKRMEVLLSPHTELIEEFLVFMLPHQALELDRFMTYLVLVKMKDFFKKLNIIFMKRQMRQVYTALESLVSRPNVTLAEVKATMLPLLKSSSLLTNHFLQLLPGERPPDSLMTDFEEVDLKDDSKFETIIVPDCPDPYGNENCICSCHTLQKNRHCISCGIKYLNGRVYLQYGKVLRPAKVTFKGMKHMDLQKWEEAKCRSRRRLLPKIMLSPSCFDQRPNADSEDDTGVKKSPRTPRIRAARSKACKKGAVLNKEGEVLEGIFPLVESKNLLLGDNMMGEVIVDCEMKQDLNEEREFDEVVMENECNTEEDEEEDLGKCLHSENESSLEAEDIAKELESGNYCSFEDEDIDEIESSEVQDKISKTNFKNTLEEINRVESPTQSSIRTLKNHTSGSDLEKKDLFNINKNFTDKNNIVDKNSESMNSLVKQQETEFMSDFNSEKMPTSTCDQLNTVTKSEEDDKVETTTEEGSQKNTLPDDTDKIYKIKTEKLTEDEIEIMDVDIECSFSTEQASQSFLREGGNIGFSDGMDTGKSSCELDSTFKEWTREEDKIILQTFQHENGLEQTFETASLQLPNRSKEEIQQRFEVLLKLLKEMISDGSNSNP